MGQTNWRAMVGGLLIMSLPCNPAFSGNDEPSDGPVKVTGQQVVAAQNGSAPIPPSMEAPAMGPFSPAPSGLGDKYDLVWDNQWRTELQIITGTGCDDLECNAVHGYLADDVALPENTIVKGFKMRFAFRAPTVAAPVDGAVFTIWPDDGGKPGHVGDSGPGWVERFTVSADDPGFSVFKEGTYNRRIEVELNPGDQWVADGGTYWFSMTPVVDSPPLTYAFMTLFPINKYPGWQSWDPEDGDRPWTDPNPGNLGYDMQFQLWGHRAPGGTRIVTIDGIISAGCAVRLRVSQESLTSCTIGECPAYGVLGAGCEASVALTGDETPSQVAAALAVDFAANATCGGPVRVTMTAAGPYIVVETDDGPRPSVCLGGGTEDYRLVGGRYHCEQDGCGLHFQVGLRDDQVLPPIEPGTDWFASDPSCTTENGEGTWANSAELGVTSEVFDRPGLPPAEVSDQRIAMRGVGRPYANDDTDTIIERTGSAIFGICSGDFINTGIGGSTTKNPDGIVDAADASSFAACLGRYDTGDCSFFDYDRDGDIDMDDAGVFDCLLLSHDDTDCCPENTTYPQTVAIATELRRMHLRSCAPIEVRRSGQAGGTEWWWVDHYISGVPPTITADALGTPCFHLDQESNDIAASADRLGFIGRENPVRVWGSISNPNCDVPGQVMQGQRDADVYRFTIAHNDLVVIRARARGTTTACQDSGGGCNCGPQLAVPSLYLYDEDGTSLLASDDPPPPFPHQRPITDPTTDPWISVVLDPGTYNVVVASAAQFRVPDPTGRDDVYNQHHCSVSASVSIPYDDYGPTTGDYELNIDIVDRSTMWVTQTNQYGGTFDSKLLVQSLVTFSRTADPFSVVVIDTGERGEYAKELYAQNESWVRGLNWTDPDVAHLIPGEKDFIPGVSADATNDQAVDPIQHANIEPPGDPTTAGVLHRVEPPTSRACQIIEGTGTVQVSNWTEHLPTGAVSGNWHYRPGGIIWNQPAGGDAGTLDDVSDRRMLTDNDPDLGQQVADDFTFAEDTTIYGMHWRGRYETNTPDLTIQQGDMFTVEFWTDLDGWPNTRIKVYGQPPNYLTTEVSRVPGRLTGDPGWQINDYYLDISATPFVAAGDTTYWISVINDSTGSPSYWYWVRSDGGNSDGRSAQRQIGDPWDVNDWDKAFDLTAGDTDTIIAARSFDCDPIRGTGIGYYFDSTHCYINGYQETQTDPQANQVHWHAVRAPWEHWDEVKLPPNTFPATEQGVIDAFEAAGVVRPADPDCLLENIPPGKHIQGVFEGVAAYYITNDYHGIEVGGMISRECNGQIVELAANPSDILTKPQGSHCAPASSGGPLGERLRVVGLEFDNQVATARIGVRDGPECFRDFNCPKRCNVCFRESCDAGVCSQTPNTYGDVDADGVISIFDVFCVLNGFGGDYSACCLIDEDIAPCGGDGTIGILDLFGVMNAFAGIDPCCYCNPTPSTDPDCIYGFPPACPDLVVDPSAGRSLSSSRTAPTPSLKLIPSQPTAHAGDLVDVDVYLSDAANVRGVQLAVEVDGGHCGRLELVAVSVDEQRRTFLLNGVEYAVATDQSGRLAIASYTGGVTIAGSAYLGTFTIEVSDDAAGVFRVGLLTSAKQTMLVDTDGSLMNIGRVTPAMITVTTPSRGR